MKALKNPVTWLALLALQGCTNTESLPPQQDATPVASLDQPKSIQPQTFVVRGQAVVGHETRTFTPCGSQQQFWLDMPSEITQQALQLSRKPYEPMYGEFIGYLAEPSQTGYNADYAARFIVKQVNLLTAENPNRCAQPVRSTRAFGTEPFWSASFQKDQVEFSKMGEDKRLFSIEKSQTSSSERSYQFSDGELKLEQQACSDNMSDSLYGWQAHFTQGEAEYQGCATLANQDPTIEWSGLYFAQSTENVGFSVELSLNADHSATTTYRYQSEDLPTVEKGFWQQLNNDQIQVVMTRHQQQYLVSERIFTRDGYQLTADKEKVGNVVYPIANGGLTLFKAKNDQANHSQREPTTHNVKLTAQQVASSDQFDQKVDDAIRHYFDIHQTSPDDTQYRWLTYDLNGDGNDELLAQLDWCGTGGCTLLIFENHQNQWRFNSRITQVKGSITLGNKQQHGWQDLLFNISGGGAVPAQHKLSYDGVSYPLNPSVAPLAQQQDNSQVALFSDGVSPRQSGVRL
ncbi:hypothetical protein EK599_23030 [Vibrio sp. T187]|uniref:COG3650 family protein n=1 Tax=Vibrio TaxID=662 RepID=UPI0010C9F1C4|nr:MULTISPECIES: hypothetical protein [Vibrio]MBW3698552.1 hypothetical protein [Vibrio sp. T187]